MTQIVTNFQLIEARFKHLFIDLKAVKKNMAKQTAPLPEPAMDRELLAVEKQARHEKKINRQQEQAYLDDIAAQLHLSIERQLGHELQDTDNLYLKILSIDPLIPQLLDVLAAKACTISRIEALASQLPWLYQDLLKMLKSPQYQRKDTKGKVLTANTLWMALSFFGIENLKMIVPYLMVRRCLPSVTDPYPRIKNRLWEQALANAMACKNLAGFYAVNENQAFSLGMLYVLGKITVVKLYFKLFDQLQLVEIKKAHDQLQHQRHTALVKLEPSGELLNRLLDKYADQTAANLITHLELRRLKIADGAKHLAAHKSLAELTGLGRVLKQGIGYAQYRILKKHNLITMQESKDYLRVFQLPIGALEVLKSTDLRSLNFKTELKSS